jgi:hypothetical protein
LVASLAAVVSVVVIGRRPAVPPQEATPEVVVDLGRLQRLEGLLVWADSTQRVFSGWATEHYAEGRPKSRTHVVDGRIDGLSEGWHPNGALKIQENFAAGVSEGLVTRWNPDGSKLSEGISRAGRFEGIFRRWHPNGALAEQLEMVGGQAHGLSRAWHPDGSPKAEARLERGTVVEQKFWRAGEAGPLAAHVAGKGHP